ncbi:hypothetical protein Ancab_009042 [Ancistrocladus abbreviatus]
MTILSNPRALLDTVGQASSSKGHTTRLKFGVILDGPVQPRASVAVSFLSYSDDCLARAS